MMNDQQVATIQTVLAARPRLYFLMGGSCTGKTTLSQAIAAQFGLPIIDMDAHIYGDYHARFTAEQHPTNYNWATAENGLAWLLAKTWTEFDRFNADSNAEYLALLAEDLMAHDPQRPILVDGGFSKPGVLAQFVPVAQIICLALPDGVSGRIWNEAEERRPMKEMVQQLRYPADAWNRFLAFDAQMSQTMVAESKTNGIRVIGREANSTVAELVAQVAGYWGLDGFNLDM